MKEPEPRPMLEGPSRQAAVMDSETGRADRRSRSLPVHKVLLSVPVVGRWFLFHLVLQLPGGVFEGSVMLPRPRLSPAPSTPGPLVFRRKIVRIHLLSLQPYFLERLHVLLPFFSIKE